MQILLGHTVYNIPVRRLATGNEDPLMILPEVGCHVYQMLPICTDLFYIFGLHHLNLDYDIVANTKLWKQYSQKLAYLSVAHNPTYLKMDKNNVLEKLQTHLINPVLLTN